MPKRTQPSSPKRREVLRALEAICQTVGVELLNYRGQGIADTHDFHGHESSTIDDYARYLVLQEFEKHLPGLSGMIRLELRPFNKSLLEPEGNPIGGAVFVDECEGTTNTKRCLASTLIYRPQAGVSIAWSTSESLADVQCSCFYMISSASTYSAMRSEDGFISFVNKQRIDPEDVVDIRGDSRPRVLVIGYSNSHRIRKGELEQAIYDKKIKVYEGCRASGVDIINTIRGQNDAYIDPRFYWSTKGHDGHEKEAMLQVYDCAGVIPVAVGCGLTVTDFEGKPWQDYDPMGPIPLIVARPAIHGQLLEIARPLVSKWKAEAAEKPARRK